MEWTHTHTNVVRGKYSILMDDFESAHTPYTYVEGFLFDGCIFNFSLRFLFIYIKLNWKLSDWIRYDQVYNVYIIYSCVKTIIQYLVVWIEKKPPPFCFILFEYIWNIWSELNLINIDKFNLKSIIGMMLAAHWIQMRVKNYPSGIFFFF